MKLNKTLSIGVAAMATMAMTSQASTIVQWGELGGDTGIVTATGNTKGQNAFADTFNAANPVNPADGSGGYDVDAVGRTNVFAGADNGSFINTFTNNTAGDYMQLIHNFGTNVSGTFVSMVAWESANFLTTDGTLESFQAEFRTRDNGDAATASFLLETSSGWYVSDQTFGTSDTSYLVVNENTADLTWTGFSQFGVTAGAGPADTSDILSVGLYSSTDSTSTFAGTYLRHFEVTAVAVPEPSSTALLGLGGLALILRRRK